MYLEPMHVVQGEKAANDKRNKRDIFTLHRVLLDIPSNDLLGYISLDIAPSQIINISEKLYVKDKEEFYIISSEGEMIFQSNNEVSEDEAWIKNYRLKNKVGRWS